MQQRHPPRGGEHVGTRTAKVIGDIKLFYYQPTLTQSMLGLLAMIHLQNQDWSP